MSDLILRTYQIKVVCERNSVRLSSIWYILATLIWRDETFNQSNQFESEPPQFSYPCSNLELHISCHDRKLTKKLKKLNKNVIKVPFSLSLFRYILLRDMVKDATHHPDYKVSRNLKRWQWNVWFIVIQGWLNRMLTQVFWCNFW